MKSFLIGTSLLALSGLAACAATPPAPAPSALAAPAPVALAAAVPPGAGRNIKPVTPDSAVLAPGASATFSARPDGGEAMRLPIDWAIREGAAGGKIELAAEELSGAASIRYTAPAAGGGPYHLVASLRRAPAVQAVATITVKTP
jgi:hypothetical protein